VESCFPESIAAAVLGEGADQSAFTKAMNLGAHHYLVKHADSHQRAELIRILEQYLTRG